MGLNVSWDEGLPILKVKDIYLHNKLLVADAGVRALNRQLIDLKEYFNEMKNNNENTISRMVALGQASGANQRAAFAENLQTYAKALDANAVGADVLIKVVEQARIYNLELRKTRKILKCPRRSRKEICDPQSLIDSIDRRLEEKVNKEIAESQKKAESEVARLADDLVEGQRDKSGLRSAWVTDAFVN